MPLKPGGGNLPQPYDPDNGQYTDNQKYSMRVSDRRALEYLKYTWKIPNGMEVHFPTKGIHDNSYGRMFVELYRENFSYLPLRSGKISYMLTKQSSGDKSKSLFRIGYTLSNSDKLYNDIIKNTNHRTIKFAGFNKHGDAMLKAETYLNNNRTTTIWVLNPRDYSCGFVTIYTSGKEFDNDKE